MKIFEFQFHPQAKEDRFFRVFSKEAPLEMTERGNMYMVAELRNALPTNSTFLDRLAEFVQQEYYNPGKPTQSASQRLKHSLKKANAFLAQESKNGNVAWLGNLHFLLLLFVPSVQEYTLYFTKVGAMKLWMARGGSLVDAGKTIESAKNEENPSKVFGNVGSGKVVAQDRIIALTQEAFDFFAKENFLQTIVQFREEKQFKSVFKSKQKEMSALSGILLFVLVEALQRESKASLPMFPLQFKIPFFPQQISLPELPMPSKFSLPPISLPNLSVFKKKLPLVMVSEAKKRTSLLALLVLVLMLGFVIFGGKKNESGNSATQEVLPNQEITDELRSLYKIVDTPEPEVVAELNPSFANANLSRMILQGTKFYFFGPSSPNIFVFDSALHTSEVFAAGKNLQFGTGFQNSVLFFAEPNIVFSIDSSNTVLQHTLELSNGDLQLAGMEQFANSLYVVDPRGGEIFKSPSPLLQQAKFEPWLDPLSAKKPINARSMSIDGNIWILTTSNEIQKYFRGKYQESLDISIVPAFRNAVLLKTNAQLPYLYMLEPVEKRIVVLAKSGEIIRQYRNETFGKVRDFAVSSNGQTMFLFDGAKVYQVSLQPI